MKIINKNKFTPPTIVFTEQAYEKILKVIFATNLEIAWHGRVTKVDEKYVITDILLYPQSATSVTVESDDDDYPSWLHNLDDETFHSLRMQGHSHVDMGVHPSGTDKKNQDDVLAQVKDYYIFMIINRKEDLHITLYDMEQGIVFENDDIDIMIPDSWAQKEVDKYLKKKKYKTRVTKPTAKTVITKRDKSIAKAKDTTTKAVNSKNELTDEELTELYGGFYWNGVRY